MHKGKPTIGTPLERFMEGFRVFDYDGNGMVSVAQV